MRTGVGSLNSPLLHGYSRKQEVTDGVAGALRGIVLSVQLQTSWEDAQSLTAEPSGGGAEASVLVTRDTQGA